jgi:4-aminobutyrate aminotransferase-like enzyme/Ser/Thr protein kinase RdoA (MazF antagonist)
MSDSRPRFTTQDAQVLAREIFGVSSEARELPAELDRNFLLETEAGDRYVLKVSPGDTDELGLACQVGALRFLAGSTMADRLPNVVPTPAGALLHRHRGRDGRQVWIRLYRYLEGHRLVKLDRAPDGLYRELGAFLARLDQQLLGFEHVGARREILWNLARTLELEPALELVGDPRRREAAGRALARFRERVVPAIPRLRTSIIHNDANDHNVLVSDLDPGAARLVGLIDFGDMIESMTAAEPAIAAAYTMLGRPDPMAAAAELIAGYDAILPLTLLERSLMFEMILGRLAASVLWAARRRRQAPENEYLLVSEEPVWRLLERLVEVPGAAAEELLFAGCRPRLAPNRSPDEILELRRRHLGGNLSISYRRAVKIVRGEGQYLFDGAGRRYLDLVNNVCHVGHCHPLVVAAIQRQAAVLNTNTRYLHDLLVEYARRLADTFPEPLSVCYFVCTGSEANDLALRLAWAATGSRETVVLDHAYHGNSPSLIEISPYKCDGPGGEGLASHAHKVPMPDPFRGLHRGPGSGEAYAGEVAAVVESLRLQGRRPGAFIAESLLGCGGQVLFPEGFLDTSFEAVRAAGGVCIADEVQVGFGRVGSHFWAFELQGVVPDIVTLGKPIGNGHPLAAVVTTPEIAAAFENGMEYFNTFGGNPVSCAAGLAVLEVMETEGLQGHALSLGQRLLSGLGKLADRHLLIGDVRGSGLFLGVELVKDRETLEPAPVEADAVIQALREDGILLSTDGPDHNVLKIKPPMVLDEADVDLFLERLDTVLSAVAR